MNANKTFKMQVNEKRKRNSKKKLKKNNLGLLSRKIPKSKLKNVLNLLNDPENDVWKFRSMGCETFIHNHKQACSYKTETIDMTNDMELRTRFAQTCLLRRSWTNLSKIILLYKPEKSTEHFLPLFAKYASICLAYSNQEMLKTFLQAFNCDESAENVLSVWTSFYNTDETSLSDDLD